MNISFEQIGHQSVTFPAGACTVGQPCKLDSQGRAVSCGNGDKFVGVVETLRGDYAGVQLHGFVTMACSGTLPAPGMAGLSANGSGGVKPDTAGKQYLVAAADQSAGTITFEL